MQGNNRFWGALVVCAALALTTGALADTVSVGDSCLASWIPFTSWGPDPVTITDGAGCGVTYNRTRDPAGGWWKLVIGDSYDLPADNDGLNLCTYPFPLDTGFGVWTGYSSYCLAVKNCGTQQVMATLFNNTGWTDLPFSEPDNYYESGWTWIAPGETRTLCRDLTGELNLGHVSSLGIQLGTNGEAAPDADPYTSNAICVEVRGVLSSQSLSVVPGPTPGSNFKVYVDLASCLNQVADVGTRLSFNPAHVQVASVAVGSAVDNGALEPNWKVEYENVAAANSNGKLDVIVGDFTLGTVLNASSGGPFQVICVEFSYPGGAACTTSVCFNTDGAPPNPAAFPEDQYLHYNPGGGATPALLENAAGPCVSVEGHGFIRGDVNMNGSASAGDIIALATHLFGSLSLPDCLAARDVNDSGGLPINITDLVTLVQGLFNAPAVVIPPPYPTRGVDPTGLGCNVGLACP
ncbi:MAG: hypothetical protein HY721_32910 [Planctomycetes bacterium]|nr:hypothetical protein [Planctomycetota bacterium]